MSLKKAKAAVADAPPESTAPETTVDEIDQLMSEIEELQEEMSGQSAVASHPVAAQAQPKPQAAKSAPAKAAPVKAAPAKAAPAPKPSLKVVPPPPEPQEEVTEAQETEDALSDFRVGASEEASLEETLGDLKDEEPAPGQSILDQVIQSEEEVHEEALVEEPVPEEVHEEIHEAVAEVEAPMEAQGHETVEQLHEEHEAEHEIVREKESTMKSNDGSLTLTLTGNMTLQLNYEFDGQAVKVGFEDGCLKVELADGTEFKVPMKSHRSKSGSKAA